MLIWPFMPHTPSEWTPEQGSLAAKAGAGDELNAELNAEFARIYRENARYVWRGLRHLGVREADLEDVLHEVFLVVGRKLSDFEGRSSMRTWLYGIALRTASDYRRSARVRREVAHSTPPESSAVATYGSAEGHTLLRQLTGLLERLPDEQRDVFVLYELEELGMKDVAEVLNCPLQTAYSRLQAARLRLRELVGQEVRP